MREAVSAATPAINAPEAGTSPRTSCEPSTACDNQTYVKPKNQSTNPANTGQATIPRLNSNLGIIGVEDDLCRQLAPQGDRHLVTATSKRKPLLSPHQHWRGPVATIRRTRSSRFSRACNYADTRTRHRAKRLASSSGPDQTLDFLGIVAGPA